MKHGRSMGWGGRVGRRPVAKLSLIFVVLAALAGAAHSGRALAHAVLLRSDPAENARLGTPPGRVDLFFSEPLDHGSSTVEVRDTSGTQVDKHDVKFTSDPTEMTDDLTTLKPGFYTVLWTTVSSVDGHKLTGTYPFTVLNADGSTPAGTPPPAASGGSGGSAGVQPLDSAVRWLMLIGLIGTVGGFGFVAFVLYPAAETLAEPDRGTARAFALWLLGGAVPAAALLALFMNAAQFLRQAETNGSLSHPDRLFSGNSAEYAVAREVLALLALLVAWWLTRREERPAGPTVYAGLGLGLLLGLGALLAESMTSHAAAGAGSYWAVPSDFLHLAGVSVWLGGVALLPVLLRLKHRLDGPARLRFQGRALGRFSTMAVLCVGLVLLSGMFNALVQMPDWSAFTGTAYGRALLIKIILLLPLLGLGLLNALRIARRFERAAGDDAPDAEARSLRIARSAVLECVAGAVVIAATAVMVFLVPAKDAVAQQQAGRASSKAATVSSVYRNTVPASDLTAQLTVSPNRVGLNDFKVLLSGTDVAKVSRVQLRFQFTAGGAGQSTVDATPVAGTPGLFDAQAANFSFVGDWRVTVNVRRDGHDDANGVFTVQVPDVTGATTSSLTTAKRSATAFPAHGITAEQTWGAILVAAGLALFVFRKRIWRASPLLGQASVLCVVGAMVVGAAVVAGGRKSGASAAANLLNPVPADQRSVQDGKQLYAQNCAACHGDTGHGDGPAAAALNPRPLDLTVHVGLHPDGQLYDWITNGIPRTGMPPWGKKGKVQFTDQQRWDLINYLRTLSVTADARPATAAPAPRAAAVQP